MARKFAGRLAMPSGPFGKVGMYSLFTMQRMGSLPLFSAPLLTSLILAAGVGLPTYSRATIATVTDWEGVVRQVASGEARFSGARRVQNLVTINTENLLLHDAGATKSNTTILSPTTLQFNLAANSFWYSNAFPFSALYSGRTFAGRVKVACTVPRSIQVRMANGGDGSNNTRVNVNVGPTPVVVGMTLTMNGVAGQIQLGMDIRNAFGANTSSDGIFTFTELHIDEVTGATNQNAGDYVSVGVLAAPFQGAGIDGVQYFPNSNGNTITAAAVTGTGGVLTPGSGTPIPSATLLGYLPEETKTNLALFSEDFTNAAWVKTGVTVTPNTFLAPSGTVTADTLTATTPLATCLQAVTITATNQVASCWVRRRTGVGAIQLSADGIAFTPIAVTGIFQRFQVTQNLGAGVVNAFFRIDVSGDEIDVWGAQYELGTVASSYVPTSAATVVRNADLLSYTSVGNVNLVGATVYCEARVPNYANPTDSNIRLVEVDDGTSTNRFGLYVNPSGTLNMFVNSGGVATDVATLGLVTINTTFKGAGSISAGKQVVDLNGAAPVLTVNNSPLALTTIRIGSFNNNLRQPNGNIRNVMIWGPQLPDLNLPPLTT